jgi:hypothetical protein
MGIGAFATDVVSFVWLRPVFKVLLRHYFDFCIGYPPKHHAIFRCSPQVFFRKPGEFFSNLPRRRSLEASQDRQLLSIVILFKPLTAEVRAWWSMN